MKTRATDRGFTLVEVMIAMAIIAITSVVLMDQRIGIVRDAGKARDLRTVWILASQKMAELQLDKTLWGGLGGSSNGDFNDVSPDYASFTWEYQIVRTMVDTSDQTPNAAPEDPKKRELFRLTLTVRAPAVDDPVVLEAEFTINPPKSEAPDSKDPANKDAQKPPDGAAPAPDPGGPKK